MSRSDRLVALLCLLWLLALLLITRTSLAAILAGMTKADAAEWFAGGATFLAVVAALGIALLEGHRQREAAKTAERENENAALKEASMIATLLTASFQQVQGMCRKGELTAEGVALFSATVEALIKRFERTSYAVLPTVQFAVHLNALENLGRAGLALLVVMRRDLEKGVKPPKSAFDNVTSRSVIERDSLGLLVRGRRIPWL